MAMHDVSGYLLQTLFNKSRAVPKTTNRGNEDLEMDVLRNDPVRVTPMGKGGATLDDDPPEQSYVLINQSVNRRSIRSIYEITQSTNLLHDFN